MANTNRFVWHDLNTRDLEASKSFYGELFNWKFESSDNGPYLHIKAGAEMIGGARLMDKNEPGPSNWLGYVAVDDVAATVGKISAAQGQVFMPVKTMDKVGTFAVTSDPTGGVFAPWKSARPDEDVEKNGPAATFTFCWDELITTDPAAATKFYTQVFGWEAMTMEMGSGPYTMLNRPGTKNEQGQPRAAGGIFKAPEMVKHSFWLAYITVENTDAIVEKATRYGAKVAVPATEVPGMGRFAAFADSQGAHLGVMQFAKR